jgi:hypothetical protein
MPDISDEFGNLFTSGSGAADGSGGFGAAARRFITAGVLNGDFFIAPEKTDAIDDFTNPLPYWSFVQASGTACSFTSFANVAAGSGRVLRMAMDQGAAGDSAYAEQIIPINGSQGRNWANLAKATAQTATTPGNNILLSVIGDYLKADGVTTTGGLSTGSATLQTLLNLADVTASPTAGVSSDALYLRVRLQLARDVAATTDSGAVYVYEVRQLNGPDDMVFANATGAATIPAQIINTTGGFLLRSTYNDATKSYIQLAADTVRLKNPLILLPDAQTITAVGDTIRSSGGSYNDLTANGVYTMTSTPTIGQGLWERQELTLLNVGANAITIQDQGTLANSNLRLTTATFAMGPRDSIKLCWATTSAGTQWIEVGRSNVI